MMEPYRIIIADDDAATCHVLRVALRHLYPQADIRSVSNGRDALALVLLVGATAMVIDERMPELRGSEVIARVRQRGFQMPILLISGFAFDQTTLDSASVLMEKPLLLDTFTAFTTIFFPIA
jgi:CheY-like chemotaxis protein